MPRYPSVALVLAAAVGAACSGHDSTSPKPTISFSKNPCSASGTLQLAVAQSAVVDCSNGGTTVTLAGGGASYLVVAQLPVDLVPNALIPYHVSSDGGASASRVPVTAGGSLLRAGGSPTMSSGA